MNEFSFAVKLKFIAGGALPKLNSTRPNPSARKDRRKAQRIEKKQAQRPSNHEIIKSNRLIANESRPVFPKKIRRIESQSSPRPLNHDHQKPSVKDYSSRQGANDVNVTEQEDLAPRRVSKRVRDQLEADDAEINALERALGVRGKKKAPKLFDDGLDDILAELEDSLPQDHARRPQQIPSEEGSSLPISQKRSSLGLHREKHNEESNLRARVKQALAEKSNELGLTTKPAPKKENPYRPPQTQDAGTEIYVPPSILKKKSLEDQGVSDLHKRIQGLLNRLSLEKLHTIVNSLEAVYESNSRHLVSSILSELLFGRICVTSDLLNRYIILHAGFIAGLHKTIDSDLGDQLVQKLIGEFQKPYMDNSGGDHDGKKVINIMSLFTQLYNLQVLGAGLIFDFIRIVASEPSDRNAELLHTIVQSKYNNAPANMITANSPLECGPQLRQDDPSSLKETVHVFQTAVEEAGGEKSFPMRNRVRIEAIRTLFQDLKNNRMKTSENVVEMRKIIGLLNSRTFRAVEPLRIELHDAKHAELWGKGRLVGSSVRETKTNPQEDSTELPEDQTRSDDVTSNLVLIAKQQGMNTDVRRSIFVTLLTSTDYEDACQRLLKLHLRRSQEREIADVVLHCAGAEKSYNPYYTLISRRLCRDRKIKDRFWSRLRTILREIDSDEEDGKSGTMGRLGNTGIVNISRLYGTLIAEGALSLTVLKVCTKNF